MKLHTSLYCDIKQQYPIALRTKNTSMGKKNHNKISAFLYESLDCAWEEFVMNVQVSSISPCTKVHEQRKRVLPSMIRYVVH